MSCSNKAVELHKLKNVRYNCAQCVLISVNNYTNLDDSIAYKLCEGFGGGMKSGEVCGCISGAIMALGLCDRANNVKILLDDFKDKFGSIYCRNLKNEYKISCDTLIEYEANKLEEVLNNGNL